MSISRKLALLDRDGTLIEHIPYLSDASQVRLLPGVADGLKALQRLGFALVLVSNQSGLGRGYFVEDQLRAVHQAMEELLDQEGVRLDSLKYCPHHPSNGCQCRKPGIGMAQEAARNLSLSLVDGIVVGDAACDIGLARNLGWRGFLLPDSSPNAPRKGPPTWQAFDEYQPGYHRVNNFTEVLGLLQS